MVLYVLLRWVRLMVCSEGLKVTNTGAPISVPVGKQTLGRIMDVLGSPIDEAGPINAENPFTHSSQTTYFCRTSG